MDAASRRIGIEQEFFLVNEEGEPSGRADALLAACREAAGSRGCAPESFVEECSRGMMEINTPPALTADEVCGSYLARLDLALRVGAEMGIRLYPLATYPLKTTPPLRRDMRYELQARALGRERFLHAGRCTGVHLHLELPRGTVDPGSIVSAGAAERSRAELLNLYNFATALDPALIALTRSSPFYEGEAPGIAARTARYRGSRTFGWEGLYTHLPEIGGLRPYATSIEELAARQYAGYRTWLGVLSRVGIGERAYAACGGNALRAFWGPVRLGAHGTVELRGIDSNYPDVIMAVVALVEGAARRIRTESLRVEPSAETEVLQRVGDRLLVPDFERLSGELLYAAATWGVAHPSVAAYLDSLAAFATGAGADVATRKRLECIRRGGTYRTTEAEILASFPAATPLSEADGLRLVREACARLEEQVLEYRTRSVAGSWPPKSSRPAGSGSSGTGRPGGRPFYPRRSPTR